LIGGVMQRGPDELVVRRDAHDLLRDVARLTGGRVLDPGDAPGAALLDQQQRIPRERTQTPWRLLLVPALILLLLDIAARRISWNRQSAGLLLRRTGERRIDPSLRAAATLSALRTSAAPRAELLAVKDDSVRPSGIAPEIGRSVDEPKETPAIEAPAAAPADRQAQIRRALDAVLGRSARAEISDAPDARKEAPHDVAPPPAEDAMSALRAAKARAKGRRGSGRE